jgi:tRNA(Glu) U13 pseudouridine synthase TruD
VVDFDAINRAALPVLATLLDRWMPGGRREGREYIARNPKRLDRRPGSFRVNMRTGRWADFATGDAGGDVISLAAYLHDLSQAEAARRIADMLGIPKRMRLS